MSISSHSRLRGGSIFSEGGDDVQTPAAPSAAAETSTGSIAPNVPDASVDSAPAEGRTRPDPKPGSRAYARVGLAQRPDGVSAHTWERLAVQIGRALGRATTRGATQLRPLVVLMTSEMRMAGADWDAIERSVSEAITTHPDFGTHDRLNVVSGKRSSESLITQMVGWVQGVRRLQDAEGESA